MPSFGSKLSTPSVKLAIKSNPSSVIRLEGYLLKQTHGKSKVWVKRYFILYDHELRYFKSKSDTNNALAVIALDHYALVPDFQTSICPKRNKHITFLLLSDDESKYDWPDYYLQTSASEERLRWEEALQKRVQHSTSVLDKWLDRLDITVDDDPIHHGLDSTSTIQSYGSQLLSPSSSSLRNHRSVESINIQQAVSRRRPSELSISKSTDLPGRTLPPKTFNWARPISYASSTISSINEPEEDEYLQHQAPIIPNKALELPIIHPSEFNMYKKELLS
ncbi:hypothetical protein EDC96DRAFT_494391 [Choanephora cucurbitarum]|nr:hypothetical protein EDC96DRAFT_494391 [Choanephora cucurbitarum]